MAPATTIACPADPLAGLSDEITGGPAAEATVVEGVVELVEDAPCPPPLRVVGDGRDGDEPVAGVPATVGEGEEGEELSVTETASAMAAATTRAAATATDPTSQRSDRRGGRSFPGRGGVPRSFAGGRARGGGGAAGRGAAPTASRARLTAISIAPKAR